MNADTVSRFLASLGEDVATHTRGAERSWPHAAWRDALSSARAVPSVREVELPAQPWRVDDLAQLSRVFPEATSWHLTSLPDESAATLTAVLSALWHRPLATLRCDGFSDRAGDALPDAAPRFAESATELRLRHAHSDTVRRLFARADFVALRSLEVDRLDAPDDVLPRVPHLRALTCALVLRPCGRCAFAHTALASLTVHLRAKPAAAHVAITGDLPALRELAVHTRAASLDLDALSALLSRARGPVDRVTLRVPQAWRSAALVARALAEAPGASRPTFAARDPRELDEVTHDERAAEFAHLTEVRALGFSVDADDALALVDRPAHLRALADVLATLDAVRLRGGVHDDLLRDPSRCAVFAAARALDVFDCDALTREGLDALLRALPRLTTLRLTNNANPAMDALSLRSASLEDVRVTHFHALQRFEVDAPALHTLELDNCGGTALDDFHLREDLGTAIVYGDLSERLLAALLDGDASVRLPSLRTLSLWNNPYGGGPLLAVESRRLSVACAAGHPTLRALYVYNLPHLRALTLRCLPSLTTLAVAQIDDRGPGTTWLERVDLAGLPEACDVSMCALTTGRVGISERA